MASREKATDGNTKITAVKKPATKKKTAAKKPAAKKSAAKKPAAKKPAAKKPAAKKSAAPALHQAKGDRVVIVAGLRTPFVRSWTTLNDMDPIELSTQVARELMYRNNLDFSLVDQVVWGTVISVTRAPNVAREVTLNLGMYDVPAFTVSRACASGFQSIASAAQLIAIGHADVVLAGGVDVTSAAPVVHKKKVIDLLQKAQKAKGLELVQTIAKLNPLDLFPVPPALTERYTGLSMGQHAEKMAQNFNISRQAQEELALRSHRLAVKATKEGRVAHEIMPVQTPTGIADKDNLIREDMDSARLARLRPVFDRKNGTITAATSSALSDGAACVLVMRESKAKELGYTPLAVLRGYHFASLDPRENMLLGNVYSVPKALERSGLTLADMDVLEIHEAFGAQVLSNIQCMESATWCKEHLGLDHAVGTVDRDKLNPWGGSMAYGHPFAATGGRMVTQLIDELHVLDGELGLVTACAAGGMGVAMVLERL